MKLFEYFKNMNKGQRVYAISTIVLVIVLISLIVTFFNKNIKSIIATESQNAAKEEYTPDVTDKNTKFEISSTEENDEVTIKVKEKLEDCDLYFLIGLIDEELENTESLLKDANLSTESMEVSVKNAEGEFKKINKKDFSLYKKCENEITVDENCKIYFIYKKDGKHSKNIYEIKIDNIVKVLQESEEVSQEQLEAEKVDPSKVTGKTAYYIKVNYGANVVTVYGKDTDGNYTVPVKAMVCSCGRATPKSGVYKTSKGYTWGTLIGGVYGQYSTRIVGSILFHSVPYTSASKDSLEYWEFDKLGTTASAGCVRLMVSDSKWIFYNCAAGTMVEFYSDVSNPGPLGKPSAPKISDNIECRNWDPTDDVPENPWIAVIEEIVEDKEEQEKQEEQQEQPETIIYED